MLPVVSSHLGANTLQDRPEIEFVKRIVKLAIDSDLSVAPYGASHEDRIVLNVALGCEYRERVQRPVQVVLVDPMELSPLLGTRAPVLLTWKANMYGKTAWSGAATSA